MDDETLAATLNDKRNSVTVLYVNGAPAGFFELLQVDEDTIELSHFGLFERALGLGIGKWFLLQTLYAAWANGAETRDGHDEQSRPPPCAPALPDVRLLAGRHAGGGTRSALRRGASGSGKTRLSSAGARALNNLNAS
ncbi:MAG: hypothetical protein QM753_07395 [Thermomicrobiales bacterium]